jgi:hypothetical protein
MVIFKRDMQVADTFKINNKEMMTYWFYSLDLRFVNKT